MEADTLNLIGIIAIFLVIIMVSILFVTSQGATLTNQLPSQIQNVFNNFISAVIQKSPYNTCEAYSGKEVSVQDFQTILQAVYHGQCGDTHANISLTFSLTKDDITKTVRLGGMAGGGNLIFYNLTKPLGVGALIIQGTPGDYPLKTYDFVDMYQQGSPTPDTFIVRTIKGCDPTDAVCDESCLYKGICDPVCETNTPRGLPCNLACIDTNHNGVVDINDANQRITQNKCNLDCYSNKRNPFKAYDPGCVFKFKDVPDGICDPNSNGVVDGVCDPDCALNQTNGICDPDCNGIKSPGNPNGWYDRKCFVCDKTCNSWCSPACTPFDNDPDCPLGFNGPRAECCGNGICNTTAGENCDSCALDCPGGGTSCSSYANVCCPNATDSDTIGCSPTKGLVQGNSCACGNQCGQGLVCDTTQHCCPEGKTWNGTDCIFKYTFTLLYIQLNGKIDNLHSWAVQGKDNWVSHTPLNQCPGKVQEIDVTDKVCSVPDQSGICGSNGDAVYTQTMQNMLNCAAQWGYSGIYTRIVGVIPSSVVCSTGGGYILGYTDIHGVATVTVQGQNIIETSVHEVGHTFGLCDEGYGIANCPDCNTRPNGICSYGGTDCFPQTTASGCQSSGGYVCPDVPESNSIHCSWDHCNEPCTYAFQFDNSAMAHLQQVLTPYCK